MPLPFDQLVAAISGAVVEAQHQVRQAHIGHIEIPRYKPGEPVDNGPQNQSISVPLLSLVNPTQLSIQEMQVTLQVDMSDVTALASTTKKAAVRQQTVGAYKWQPERYKPVLEASTTTGKQPGQTGLAQVTLTIAAEEVPEGLARLQDQLNKAL